MRVVHVAWSLDELSGGLARAVVLIANAHAAAGLDVTVLTTLAPGEVVDAARLGFAPAVEVLAFDRTGAGKRFAGSAGLRQWLAANLSSEDAVHTHAVWDLASVVGGREARRRGCRLVMSPHGSLEPFDLRKHARAKRVLGPLVLRPALAAATVHCTTRREADRLTAYGASPVVEVLPLPVGEPPARPGDPDRFRRRHDVPAGVPTMLFLGRVNYKKGLTHLVRAMAAMRVPAHLVVAGTGEADYERTVRDLAEQLGIAERITWVGWVDRGEQADAFDVADVFVLLSDTENYGISVVEALQHDIVVVASDEVGVAADLAGDGAVLISPRTPSGAAARLDEVLTDTALRTAVRERGREVLRHDLDDVALAERYAALASPARTRR